MDFEEELFDEDGYPTEEALQYIRLYHYNYPHIDLMAFAIKLWSYPDYVDITVEKGWDNKDVQVVSMSTGGWSGNEDVIRALEENTVWWAMNWFSSQRGGHYVFKLRIPE